MNLFEIEIGRRYKYHHRDGEYFVTVKEKWDGRIGVVLEEKVGAGRSGRRPPGAHLAEAERYSPTVGLQRISTLLRLLPSVATLALACRDGEMLK
jgi:hypothetical protein